MGTVLTAIGEEWAASRMAGTGTYNVAASHIGWGTGTTAAAKSQTALVNEVGTRGSATITLDGTGTGSPAGTDAKFKAVATLTAASSYAITEAGLFNASSSGYMFVRGDFGVINLNSGDQITFTITIDPQ